MILEGKKILLGISGGIAAYKSAALASLLVKKGAEVHVLMTEHATQFINPITFETLTGHKCLIDTFDRNFEYNVEHIAIAQKADAVIVAPATANVIAKLAHGLADDMLTTTILACRCPKIIAPSMNTAMYENKATQENLEHLKTYHMEIADPINGRLACGETGLGKMPEPEELLQYVLKACAYRKDFLGKKILVTAGPTQEAIDPVRYITNHSTGKMGYNIANVGMLRGAEVTLVTGPTAITPPKFVNVLSVTSAGEMFRVVTQKSAEMDILIKAAAVADYRPMEISDEKIKKTDSELSLKLSKTEDILKYLGVHKKTGQFICGFSMETQNMLDNSRKKLNEKAINMIVANDLNAPGAGFAGDTNIVTLITAKEQIQLNLMSKDEVAEKLLDEILKRM